MKRVRCGEKIFTYRSSLVPLSKTKSVPFSRTKKSNKMLIPCVHIPAVSELREQKKIVTEKNMNVRGRKRHFESHSQV